MTDDTESTSSGSEPPSLPPDATTGVGTSTSGASLVMIGGALVLGSWVIFELFVDGYVVGWPAVLLAIMAVTIPRANRSFIEKIAPVDAAMKAVGYLLGLFGIVLIATDLRFASSALDSAVEIIGALVAYAGYVAGFLGARSIDA